MSSSLTDSSPRKNAPAGFQPYSATVPDAKSKKQQNVLAMTNKFAGPMPADEFLKKFLPVAREDRPDCRGAFKHMKKCASEKAMYDVFINCVEAAGLGKKDKKTKESEYVFVNTATKKDSRDTQDRGYQMMDMGLYHKDHVPPRPKDVTPNPRWDRVALFAEFKTEANTVKSDPFEDDDELPDGADSDERRNVRGQIIGYAAEIFAYQHRTHLFSLVILGHYARFVRWDRSGAVFSKKINYADKPKLLSDFIWRFVNASPKEQGYDETAEEIVKDSAEYETITTALKQTQDMQPYQLNYIKNSFDPSWPWYKLRVDVTVDPPPSDSAPASSTREIPATEPRYFLVGQPHTPTAGLTGRATRGYIAWDVSGRRFVFLKDCWRVDSPNLLKEGDTLRQLNKANVHFVPTLVCDGDVAGQTTSSPDHWCDRDGAFNAMKRHVHYRLVVKEIGQNLKEFTDSRELVEVIYECICAHAEAFGEAHILHRDVSAGNILILRTRNADGEIETSGLLNDWDLSKSIDIQGARQADRTGTWQFMSGRLLDDPCKSHELEDDLESFLHVLIYEAVQYLPADGCLSVGDFMSKFFDYVEKKNGEICGGAHKIKSFLAGRLELKFQCPSLQVIVSTLFKWFQARYRLHEDSQEVLSAAGPLPEVTYPQGPRKQVFLLDRRYRADDKPDPVDLHKIREEYEKVAGYLRDHKHMVNLFRDHLLEGNWPGNDKEPCKVPRDYKNEPWRSTSKTTSKRSASMRNEVDAGDERRSKVSRTKA